VTEFRASSAGSDLHDAFQAWHELHECDKRQYKPTFKRHLRTVPAGYVGCEVGNKHRKCTA